MNVHKSEKENSSHLFIRIESAIHDVNGVNTFEAFKALVKLQLVERVPNNVLLQNHYQKRGLVLRI
jgi:hypothetical protein